MGFPRIEIMRKDLARAPGSTVAGCGLRVAGCGCGLCSSPSSSSSSLASTIARARERGILEERFDEVCYADAIRANLSTILAFSNERFQDSRFKKSKAKRSIEESHRAWALSPSLAACKDN